ncbi:MAG TPA: hypothetical protein VFY06_11575 [Verrucomicrobiae bacterium]|nr:hypothetical protein [Verrucomicrobiae bacterium]
MATYTIIGGDGKEYGSVLPEDLRRWIADGRLNAQSLAKAESDAEFRPLSTFPEFADVFAPQAPSTLAPPPLTATGSDGRAVALQQVRSPAVGLMVTAILDLLLGVWSVIQTIFFPPNTQELNSQLEQLHNPQAEQFIRTMLHLLQGPVAIGLNLFGVALSVLILMGALKMKSLQSYEFAMTAAIVAMLPCVTPCCIIGLPIGIWALVVLRSPAVKSQFH